jgi:stage V sporulation protein G
LQASSEVAEGWEKGGMLFASRVLHKIYKVKTDFISEVENMVEITEVRIYKMENSGNLKAYATVTLDESYAVHGLKVLEGEKGLWVSMPATKSKKTGEFKDVFHPISPEARLGLVDAVLLKYNEDGTGEAS